MVEKLASQTIQSFDYQWKHLPGGDNLLSDRNWRENVDKFILDELQMTREQIRGKRVLDAGCGQGRWSYGFIKLGATVRGIDTSVSAIKYANEHLKRTTPPARFCVLNVLDERQLSKVFNNAEFDIIWCWGVLHHTGDPEKGFDNLVKLLKPGGTIHLYLYGKKSFVNKFWRRVFNVMPLDKRKRLAERMARLQTLVGKIKLNKVTRFPVGAFYNLFPFSPSAHSNFDAYSPSLASNHAEKEVKEWFTKRGLIFMRYTPKWASIVMRGKTGKGWIRKPRDLYVSGVKKRGA
jgi:SAM-dependent methyltransferase